MTHPKKILFCLLSLSFLPAYGQTTKVDNDLMAALNSEANHETVRRGQFKPDRDSKKVFDNEREKGLALFLEQQEKWDLIREKGLADQRKQKKEQSPVEGGPEYIADQKVKKAQEQALDQARILTLQTRERIREKTEKSKVNVDEMEELGIAQTRPRFDLRKRGQNKWVKGNAKAGSVSGSSGSSAPPPVFDDFPPQPDYIPAPQPIDGFEEIPPPPPMNFDNGMSNASPYNGGVDSGFGDIPPPPPPPPMDYDF